MYVWVEYTCHAMHVEVRRQLCRVSFRLCVHPRNRTQVIALVWQNLYLLSLLCQSVRLFLFFCVSI